MIRVCGVLGVALSMAAGAAVADCKVEKIADLAVTMADAPLVKAKINGTEERFIADSGAFFSLISPAMAAQLNLRTYAAPFNLTVGGVGGEAAAELTRVKQFSIAGATIPDVEFLVAGNGLGPEAAGLLGQNILGLADIEYDLANGVIRLWKPHDCGNRELAYWLEKDQAYGMVDIEPMGPGQRHTVGEAYINGVKTRVFFDTGGGGSFVTTDAAKRAGISRASPGVVPGGVMKGGIGLKTFASYVAPVASFKVGGEEIRNTHLRIGDAKAAEVEMWIGVDFFLSHRIYVSNAQHRLYFTYNGGPVFDLSVGAKAAPESADTSGKPAAGAQPADDADTLARRGAASTARLDYVDAIADLTRARVAAPNNPDIAYERAVAYLGNRQPFLAMSDLNDAIRLKPNDTTALVLRARLNLSGADKAHAVADLDAVDHAAAKEAEVRLTLAELYSDAEAPMAAIAQYDLWLKSHPVDVNRSTALNGRCRDRATLGQELLKALADCDSALRLNSKLPQALDSRGLVHLRLGQFDKAITDYSAALALRPDIPWSRYGRGIAELRAGKSAEGKADIAAAVALAPDLPARAKAYGVAP
jgi:tetratricopeptide (TPR) repeat protein/predicted aspartyl protease